MSWDGYIEGAVDGRESKMNEELPNVLLSVSGDVAKAHGETADGISWRVYAERDREDRSRCQIYVASVQVADISVHARRVALTDDTQAICAALVWSAIRSVRLGKYEAPCVERRGACAARR